MHTLIKSCYHFVKAIVVFTWVLGLGSANHTQGFSFYPAGNSPVNPICSLYDRIGRGELNFKKSVGHSLNTPFTFFFIFFFVLLKNLGPQIIFRIICATKFSWVGEILAVAQKVNRTYWNCRSSLSEVSSSAAVGFDVPWKKGSLLFH